MEVEEEAGGELSILAGILRRINRLYPANKQCHAELARLTGKVGGGGAVEVGAGGIAGGEVCCFR